MPSGERVSKTNSALGVEWDALPEVDADEDGEAKDGVLVGGRDGLNLLRGGVVDLSRRFISTRSSNTS